MRRHSAFELRARHRYTAHGRFHFLAWYPLTLTAHAFGFLARLEVRYPTPNSVITVVNHTARACATLFKHRLLPHIHGQAGGFPQLDVGYIELGRWALLDGIAQSTASVDHFGAALLARPSHSSSHDEDLVCAYQDITGRRPPGGQEYWRDQFTLTFNK